MGVRRGDFRATLLTSALYGLALTFVPTIVACEKRPDIAHDAFWRVTPRYTRQTSPGSSLMHSGTASSVLGDTARCFRDTTRRLGAPNVNKPALLKLRHASMISKEQAAEGYIYRMSPEDVKAAVRDARKINQASVKVYSSDRVSGRTPSENGAVREC